MRSEQSGPGPRSYQRRPVIEASALLWLVAVYIAFSSLDARANDEATQFFENEIRPLLIERCSRCHGDEEQSGGLRVDSRRGLIQGGDSGPAIIPGDVSSSRIVQAVQRAGDLEMPPDQKLTDREIRALQHWIRLGAHWPKTAPALMTRSAKANEPLDRERLRRERSVNEHWVNEHWAFQPIVRPETAQVDDASWIETSIDTFVAAKLKAAGLAHSPSLDRRGLIRRATYALTGLPPSPSDVARFVHDPDPNAYERLVDRLLNSPQYGEHWGRQWLDVARYSDTKGYVYAREERFWVHAWAYRDWVVRALNEDLPYNRFLLLQLAADQMPSCDRGDLAAMGFLTIGRRFLGVKHDIIDDRIDVVCRGTMGLTVGCARCHDHKYDPIPTADYYSLYGVFDSCVERLVSLETASSADEQYEKELRSRQDTLRTKLAEYRAETSDRVRERLADYIHAQTELDKYPAEGFDQVFAKTDLLPEFVRRWQAYLAEADRRDDPVFAAWHAYAQIPADAFARHAVRVTRQLQDSSNVNPVVAQAFADPPSSLSNVVERYGAIFEAVNARWQSMLAEAAQTSSNLASSNLPTEFSQPQYEQLRRVLYGPKAPCEVPDESIVNVERFFDSASCTQLWKLQGEVDRWLIQSKSEFPYALTLVDRPIPARPRVFRRGDPTKAADEVPRQFLALLSGPQREPFRQGSGRLELARAIVEPTNPLTARVIVNRVWARHFGQGLVLTPSDFGTRAAPPSHPELLDWLASRLVSEGWSLKELHRTILLSATFRQASTGPTDAEMRAHALQIDPANRLLWRMNPRRLSFEELRDSLLVASGDLDRRFGGKPQKLFQQPLPTRRTLYGLVDRQFLPGTLRMFDFANPDLHIPQRNETTVPQQALFFMNNPIVLERSRALAKTARQKGTPDASVIALFQQALQRQPTDAEMAEALQLVRAAAQIDSPQPRATAAVWKYGYGALDDGAERVMGFTQLPHFTGQAWQGGPKWPDSKLGWVQLTADGGHPGNDQQHASIRRWTAPRPMSIEVRSRLSHEAAAGDGIRAFIVSSSAGMLHSSTIHQQTAELDLEPLEVAAGETIDFVVDIGDVLHSDQYLWHTTISERSGTDRATIWDSKEDFPRATADRLSAWDQLAQVLLCTNEFLFVD